MELFDTSLDNNHALSKREERNGSNSSHSLKSRRDDTVLSDSDQKDGRRGQHKTAKMTGNSIVGMSKLTDYELYNQLGQGTFGVVTKARQKSSGKLVAIKKFIVKDKKEGFPITAFREITIMKKLKNINILQIVDMIHEKEGSFFYTVSPYISSDLNGLLNNPRISLSLPQIKSLMQQILRGINYVHQSGYLHRDIKTANILLDHFGIVKIADFGLARLFHGDPPSSPDSPPGGGKFEYTGLVVTRWYRPPELLLGDRKYTTAVDMWGIGCVFGELFTKKPILEGRSDVHQAEIIFRLLGSPTPENFPNCHLINRHGIDLKNNYPRTLEATFSPLMTRDALKLLAGMLTLDPMKRFNALKCLQSSFFTVEPMPCDCSELSNLEESHESDVRRFKDEVKAIPAATKPFPAKAPIQQPTNRNNNSLNHSKYGIDAPNYMHREDSTSNLAAKPYYENGNSNAPGNTYSHLPKPPINDNSTQMEDAGHHYQFGQRSQKRQMHQPQHQVQYSDNYRRPKRSYNYYQPTYSNGYRYQNDYPYEEDYYYERKKRYKPRFPPEEKVHTFPKDSKEDVFSSLASGKDLYGPGSTGDTTGLSALTKVLMKQKQVTAAKTSKDSDDSKKSGSTDAKEKKND